MADSNLCAGCHTDREDGTFGGIAPFNVNDWQHLVLDTEEALALYIADEMPKASVGACIAECAADAAAYLWSLKINNILPNAGGEAGTVAPWTGNGATLALNSLAYEGQNSILVTERAANWAGPQVSLKDGGFEAGLTYAFTVDTRLAQGAASAVVELKLQRGDSEYINLDAATVSADGWTKLSGVYTIPASPAVADLSTLKLFVESPSAATNFHVDNLTAVQFDGPVIAANLNGDFEGSDFSRWTQSGDAPVVATMDQQFAGAYSMGVTGRVNSYDSPEGLLTELLKSGSRYEVSMYVKLGAGVATQNVTLKAKYSYSGIQSQYPTLATVAASSSEWVKIVGSFEYKPVAGEPHTISVYLETDPAAPSFYIDDFVLRGEMAEPAAQ